MTLAGLAPDYAPVAWILLATGALLVGVAKTALGGLATVAVALYAAAMPARESTAALLLVLLVGDLLAVSRYHAHCDWRLIRHLLPGVVPGVVLGAAALAVVDDLTLRRGIGALLLALLLLQLWVRAVERRSGSGRREWGRPARAATGAAAGAATMVANAAGPVMTLYLLGQRVDKLGFLGTSAWFFLCVNLTKLPFSVGLGLVDGSMIVLAVVLAPVVVAGGLLGVRLADRLRQGPFEYAVIATSAVSAAALLMV